MTKIANKGKVLYCTVQSQGYYHTSRYHSPAHTGRCESTATSLAGLQRPASGTGCTRLNVGCSPGGFFWNVGSLFNEAGIDFSRTKEKLDFRVMISPTLFSPRVLPSKAVPVTVLESRPDHSMVALAGRNFTYG